MNLPDHPKSFSTPDLDWLEDGVPKASRFDDTYFSRAGGLSETRHVFLAGNGLPDRWSDRACFTIGELGFGTGLNFLAVHKEKQKSHPDLKLVYVSFELYPMSKEQLAKALGAFPDLEDEAAQLCARWAPALGWQVLEFANTRLVLGIGDARQLINNLKTASDGSAQLEPNVIPHIDAWFLDGFSPAKNPELWEEDLLRTAASLTAPDGTCASYTSAGWVRRNLAAAGFEVEKTNGFAGKREMVTGRRSGRGS
ncbi:tRNA 5-methylaminomethyl-2-thiouridine synthase [Roseibium hamelinense]|nr:tRNA (5-methylaminomethyl-2-thiouridine)(34)-methyltransferase MnmD [Roseibium hamelinense]MTI42775.1 tRNA 5-methylaminomethyl-2-thiouridine synthase [Roseibium hamelinense]